MLTILFLINNPFASAATLFDFQPLIEIEQRYDDNLYLTSSNTRSDWITRILPGFSTSLLDPRFNLELAYTPAIVYFLHNPEFDYTGHELNFNTTLHLTSQLTYSFEENYIRSNEPDIVEGAETEDERNLRRDTRAIINLNSINSRLNYNFGRENNFNLYYRNTNFRSQDHFEDDFREHYADTTLDYWFNIRNGISLLFKYTKGNFDIQTDLLYAYQIAPRYRFRLNPHFELFSEYAYSETNFEERKIYQALDESRSILIDTEDLADYDLHQFNIGFIWQLLQNLNINGSIGYFWREGVDSRDDDGLISLFSIEQTTQDLIFNLTWESGYNANYFAVRDSGFSKYWTVSASTTYSYRDKLIWTIRGSYSYVDYEDIRPTDLEEAIGFILDGRDDDRYRFMTRLSYQLLSNFGYLSDLSLEVEYRFAEVDSNLDNSSYTNHQSLGKIIATF